MGVLAFELGSVEDYSMRCRVTHLLVVLHLSLGVLAVLVISNLADVSGTFRLIICSESCWHLVILRLTLSENGRWNAIN